jgi:cellulose synthase/poly-beta-1,6-N-acetylglucosamine synthase-like glycosyltransferase
VSRPAVDVVIPVAGSAAQVADVVTRARAMTLRDGDTITVVDNRGTGVEDPYVLVATEVHTSYFARNAGAGRGSAPWLLFLDADVQAPPDLIDRLFADAPGPRTAVLAGAIIDEPAGPAAPLALRYAELKQSMAQDLRGTRAFAQTANCAVRREAFEAAGGFREDVRSGGDADLCWRIAAAGWDLEGRSGAAVVHRNRATVTRMLAQRFRHGAGAGWLAREHPGAMPARRRPGLAWWALRRAAAGIGALARGDRDGAIVGLLDGPAVWAFELGRLMPNRPLRRGRNGAPARG